MKRILVATAVGALLSLTTAAGAWAFGWKDVVKMHRDGIADSLIIQKIDHSGKRFHLEAKEIHALKEADVSDEVISAMLETEDQYEPRDSYYDDYGYYYHSPRVYVGLGLGYHSYPWYYGGYPYYGGYGYYGGSRYYGHYPRYYGGRYYGYTPRYRSYERYGGHTYPNYGTSRVRTHVGGDTKRR